MDDANNRLIDRLAGLAARGSLTKEAFGPMGGYGGFGGFGGMPYGGFGGMPYGGFGGMPYGGTGGYGMGGYGFGGGGGQGGGVPMLGMNAVAPSNLMLGQVAAEQERNTPYVEKQQEKALARMEEQRKAKAALHASYENAIKLARRVSSGLPILHGGTADPKTLGAQMIENPETGKLEAVPFAAENPWYGSSQHGWFGMTRPDEDWKAWEDAKLKYENERKIYKEKEKDLLTQAATERDMGQRRYNQTEEKVVQPALNAYGQQVESQTDMTRRQQGAAGQAAGAYGQAAQTQADAAQASAQAAAQQAGQGPQMQAAQQQRAQEEQRARQAQQQRPAPPPAAPLPPLARPPQQQQLPAPREVKTSASRPGDGLVDRLAASAAAMCKKAAPAVPPAAAAGLMNYLAPSTAAWVPAALTAAGTAGGMAASGGLSLADDPSHGDLSKPGRRERLVHGGLTGFGAGMGAGAGYLAGRSIPGIRTHLGGPGGAAIGAIGGGILGDYMSRRLNAQPRADREARRALLMREAVPSQLPPHAGVSGLLSPAELAARDKKAAADDMTVGELDTHMRALHPGRRPAQPRPRRRKQPARVIGPESETTTTGLVDRLAASAAAR